MGRIIYMVSPTALLGRRGQATSWSRMRARKALQCADRGYVLETGTIVLTGSGEALLKSNEVQVAYLGGAAKFRA